MATDQVQQLKKQADAGNAVAQFQVGLYYAKEKSTGKDDTKAFKYYQLVATQGHNQANWYLGLGDLEVGNLEQVVLSFKSCKEKNRLTDCLGLQEVLLGPKISVPNRLYCD